MWSVPFIFVAVLGLEDVGQPNIIVILPLSTSLVLASRHFLATSRKGEPEGCFEAFLAATEAAIELVGAELADK